jgi:hypothetical protein
MESPPQCASCLVPFGKGRKHEVLIKDGVATLSDLNFGLPLHQQSHGFKVCTRCLNKNSELANGKKRSAPSSAFDAPIPTKKKRESTFLRERYLVDSKSVEALSILLVNACPTCGGNWSQLKQRGKGSVLEMDIICEGGHSCTWSSTQMVAELLEGMEASGPSKT